MPTIDWILRTLGEVHANAHALARRTGHSKAIEIVKLCNELAEQYEALKTSLSDVGAGVRVPEERKTDFLMFKRLLFQVRDKAVTEGSYLYFLAGYFGIIPTPDDLKIPEKGCFKIEEKKEET